MIPYEREALVWSVRRRLTWALGVMLAVIGVLLLRSWYLQVLHHDRYLALAQSNRVRTVVEMPERGLIFDRYGRELVANVPSFDLALVLDDVVDLNATVDRLAALLDLKAAPMLKAAKRQRSTIPYLPVTVRKNLSLSQVSDVEWAHIPGAVVRAETERHYPYGKSAVHLLGYVGEITEAQLSDPAYQGVLPGTRVGQAGAEKVFGAALRGEPGRRRIEVDAKGFEVRELSREPPILGNDLYLTIDVELQEAAEHAMAGKRGAVVALDPDTGEVLALVSQPAFDAEAISRGMPPEAWKAITDNPAKPLVDRAVQGAYPPGSIFKIPVAAAVMETLPGDHEYYCPGRYPFMGRTYRDWKVQGHGWTDLNRAIVESCDVFFYEYGNRVGIDAIAEYAGRFGFGRRTGIDLPGESPGILPSTRWKRRVKGEVWYPGETLSAAIGQGYVSATPLQVAAFIGSVGTDGLRFVPTVRYGVWDNAADRLVVVPPRELPRVELAKTTFQALQRALVGVVASLHGTGHAARSTQVSIAGKTGTAQVVSLAEDAARHVDPDDVPRKLRDHAWFTAYAPAVHPRIAVAVMVEHGGHGGGVAGPIARQVIETFLKLERERPHRDSLPDYLASLRDTEG
jgi:penicillin-binding protein 2